MLSDFYISWVSFGEATHNIGNINTVGVLIFNPNDPYISVHSERGSVTHSSSRDTGIDGELRTADSDEHIYCTWPQQYSAHGRVTHARCCLLMLMGGSAKTSCSLHVLLYACGVCPGLCARERATKAN